MSWPARSERAVSEGATRTVEIVNKRGLHARASAKFVKTASGFDAEVIAGLNLPMLIKLASVRGRESLVACVAHAQEAGRKYISVASYVLAGEK